MLGLVFTTKKRLDRGLHEQFALSVIAITQGCLPWEKSHAQALGKCMMGPRLYNAHG